MIWFCCARWAAGCSSDRLSGKRRKICWAAKRRSVARARRGDDVDVGQREARLFDEYGQRVARKLLRLLAAVEALFLENVLHRPVAQERQAAIVCLGDETEDLTDSLASLIRGFQHTSYSATSICRDEVHVRWLTCTPWAATRVRHDSACTSCPSRRGRARFARPCPRCSDRTVERRSRALLDRSATFIGRRCAARPPPQGRHPPSPIPDHSTAAPGGWREAATDRAPPRRRWHRPRWSCLQCIKRPVTSSRRFVTSTSNS